MRISDALMLVSYSVEHVEGDTTLRVACEGYVISNHCSFTYKAKQEEKQVVQKDFSLSGEYPGRFSLRFF